MVDDVREKSTPFLLVVDDDPGLQEVLHDIFHYAGYRVATAANADRAIQILQSANRLPKLIISDLLMPGTDGYQFMLSVRQEALWKHIPFLFISGQEATYLFDRPSPTGVIGYLSKPFPLDDLLAVVARVVESE
jgi:CheY-like chemotaxis protein